MSKKRVLNLSICSSNYSVGETKLPKG